MLINLHLLDGQGVALASSPLAFSHPPPGTIGVRQLGTLVLAYQEESRPCSSLSRWVFWSNRSAYSMMNNGWTFFQKLPISVETVVLRAVQVMQ